MNKKTLLEIVLTGTLLIVPRLTGYESDNNKIYYSNKIEAIADSPLKKAGLTVYGEYQKTLGTNFFELYRLVYSDKFDQFNPAGFVDLKKKTEEELRRGIILRDSLENEYNRLFKTSNLSMEDNKKWGRLIDGKQSISEKTFQRTGHEALDIFAQEGSKVLAPFNGIVVASGDGWQGTFGKGETLLTWNNQGLMPAAGNAVIIYNPLEKGYMLISHMKEGLLVKAGDIISKKQIIGYVGHSGGASMAGHGRHIHVAYKLQDNQKYLRGINFSKYLKDN